MVDMSGHLIHNSSSSFQGISITDLRHINFTYFNLFSSLNSCVTLGDRTNNHWFKSSFDSPIASFTSRKPLTFSLPIAISSVILLTLCHTIHVWLVRRIWLCFNSIFFPVLFCLILYRCCEDIGHPWDRQVKARPIKYLLVCAKSRSLVTADPRHPEIINEFLPFRWPNQPWVGTGYFVYFSVFIFVAEKEKNFQKNDKITLPHLKWKTQNAIYLNSHRYFVVYCL